MTKLPVLSGYVVIKALRKAGFCSGKAKGFSRKSREGPRKQSCQHYSALHENLKKGTLHRIIKDSGLTLDQFLDLLYSQEGRKGVSKGIFLYFIAPFRNAILQPLDICL